MKKHQLSVQIALISALAICLSIIEGFIPMPGILYGAKLGLSNIAVMVALALVSPSAAFGVVVLKAGVTALLTGTISALPYSLLGGIMAFFVMAFAFKRANGKISFVGIGVLGAVFHSIGQVIASVLIIQSLSIFAYLPVLLFVSSVTGFFTGLCTNLIVFRLSNINME